VRVCTCVHVGGGVDAMDISLPQDLRGLSSWGCWAVELLYSGSRADEVEWRGEICSFFLCLHFSPLEMDCGVCSGGVETQDRGGIVVTREDGTVHSGNVIVCKQYNFVT
jgi:hypothetical protein